MMDEASVRHAYRRWAPVYDYTFGQVAEAGRKHAVKIINARKGSVLEVGVGTGLSLPCYGSHLTITGIDLSPEMLEKARARVARAKLGNVAGLYEMDAGALTFADESFDTVVAMYVMTVVPYPERVMRELERVCAPGGEVVLVNHFSQDDGARGFLERKLAPFADLIGWRSGVRARPRARLRRPEARGAPVAQAVRPIHHAALRQGARLWDRSRACPAGTAPGQADAGCGAAAGAHQGEDQVADRANAGDARRLLDTNYWRTLYRRLASQLAE